MHAAHGLAMVLVTCGVAVIVGFGTFGHFGGAHALVLNTTNGTMANTMAKNMANSDGIRFSGATGYASALVCCRMWMGMFLLLHL